MKTRGNHFIVFLLPALLMIVMAVGGYFYLKNDQSNEVTNADLQDNIDWSGSLMASTVELSWQWPAMPADGMFGDDYIGVTGAVESLRVELHASDGILYEADGVEVDNGWIVAFPNELDENKSLGNRGTLIIELESDDVSYEDLEVFLLHTWAQHAPLEQQDATFSDPTFGEASNVPFWVEEIEVSSYVY